MNESPEDILDRGGVTELPPREINDEVLGPDHDYGFAAPPTRSATPSTASSSSSTTAVTMASDHVATARSWARSTSKSRCGRTATATSSPS
jgi:hypothetical protein